MAEMTINGVRIDDVSLGAAPRLACAAVVTGPTARWAAIAAGSMAGAAPSATGGIVEAGIDRPLKGDETPDGRPGLSLLLFAEKEEDLQEALTLRVGRGLAAVPGAACYSGLASGRRLRLGAALTGLGGGAEIVKRVGERRFRRIPLLDGEFLVEDDIGAVDTALGDVSLLIVGASSGAVLGAAAAAVTAAAAVAGVILPAPGGASRLSRHAGAQAFYPTLRSAEGSALAADENAVLELLLAGLDASVVGDAIGRALAAVTAIGRAGGITRITAPEAGARQRQLRLREFLP